MHRNEFQKGQLSVFYSVGSSPLRDWALYQKNGYCKRVVDDDIKSIVFEIMSTNVSTMYIYSPKSPTMSLGVKLPFLVMLIKNMRKYFTFEVKIVDDTRFMRRFRVSNFQSRTSVSPFCTTMPMGMSDGWNQIHFNLADFTRRAYGTNYLETVRMQIHANVRIRRIYFADALYTEDELPDEYRLMRRPKERLVKDYKVPAARPPSPAKSAAQADKPADDEAQAATGEEKSMNVAEDVPAKEPEAASEPQEVSAGDEAPMEPTTEPEAQMYYY